MIEIKRCIDCKSPIVYKQLIRSKRCTKCLRKHNYTIGSRKEKTIQRAIASAKYSSVISAIYDGKCAICKWYIKESEYISANGSRGNEIHHIVSIKNGGNDDVSNLILLCPNHHKLADCGVISIDVLKSNQRQAENIDDAIAGFRTDRDIERTSSRCAEDYL